MCFLVLDPSPTIIAGHDEYVHTPLQEDFGAPVKRDCH